MTNPNNSEKSENNRNSKEKNAKTQNGQIWLLYEQAFRDVIGTSEWQKKSNFELDPEKYNLIENKKLKLTQIARDRAIYLHDNSEEFSDITTQELDNYNPDSDLIYQFQVVARWIQVARERFSTRTEKLFWDKLTPDQKKIIDTKIKKLTLSEIYSILDSRRWFQEYLETNLWMKKWDLKIDFLRIEKIFPDLENTAPDLYEWVRDHIASTGTIENLSRGLLMQIYRHYNHKPGVQKNIAEEFWLELSLKDCMRYGILEDAILEKIVSRYVSQDVWNSFSPDQKKRYISWLKNDEGIKVSPETLSNFETLLKDEKFQEIADQALNNELEFLLGWDKNPILGDIKPDIINQWAENEEWLWHRVWMQKMDQILKKQWINIDGFEKVGTWAVISFVDPTDKKTVHTIRIDKQDTQIDPVENGIEYTILTAKEWWVWTKSTEKNTVSYTNLGIMLLNMSSARVFSAWEFEGKISKDLAETTRNKNLLTIDQWEKVFDVPEGWETLTKAQFLEKIDEFDSEGKKIAFEPGMVFISKSWEDKYHDREFSYKISSIDESGIVLEWEDEKINFDTFYEKIQIQGFRRIGKIDGDTGFIHWLKEFWVDEHAIIKNWLITLDDSHGHDDHEKDHGHGEDSHGHGDHWHDKKWPTQYNYFKSASGGHIKIFWIKNGRIQFGEWRWVMDLDKVQKANSAGKVSAKEIEKLYTDEPSMDYAMFIDYLRKNKYKATNEDLLQDPDASYHEAHFHMEETLLKRWMKRPSLADIFNWVSGLMHAAEHYFEKGSKLNGSRSALWMAKKLGLPADIVAQLQSDEIGNMKGIITKIKEKLQWLNGPIARKKALHIAHMKWSRPEEIAAAALYMVESYGHLYAEDIAYAQWSETFINALIYSCGYTSEEAIREQKVKARIKFRADIGTEDGGQITEEEMIWWFMKWIDGNAENNPLAGALVKAMGGPSGWERSWRTEWTKNAIDKWIRQTGDIPNAEGRLNKYLSALATHEFHTAYGMMKNIPGKDPSPMMQGAPIIWALCGMTQYASTKLVQDNLWQFVASQGHSFHAYSFLRNKPKNDLYRDVFLSAMDWIADSSDIDSLRKSISAVQYDWHRKEDPDFAKKQIKHFQNINNIWRKYCNRGLHDRLQGNSPWMVEQIHDHDNKQVSEYFSWMNGTHSMMSKERPPSDNSGWEDQFWYKDSMIIKKSDDWLMSLDWQLNKIPKAGSTNFALNTDYFIRYWPPIVDAFEKLRKSGLSEELKKKQYYQFRMDILEHFRSLLNSMYHEWSMDDALRKIKSQPYAKDLLKMWITLEEIFTQEYSTKSGIASDDYESWLSGGRIFTSKREAEKVQQKTQDLLTKMQDNDTWAREKMKNLYGKTSKKWELMEEYE